MKQYYIYLNNQQEGPLYIEDLKRMSISRETLVWHEGLTEWQRAESVTDLSDYFKNIPPPINNISAINIPTLPLTGNTSPVLQSYDANNSDSEAKKILGIKRNFFLYGMLALALIIGISAFNLQKNNDYDEKIQQQQLNAYDSQLEEQQKAIEEQNKRIAEQERLERERIEKERKQALEKRINEIAEQLSASYQNLEQAKRHLHDVSAFKVLRTSSERHQQVSAAEDEVKTWENNIEELESEMKKINPKW
jgi:hypothetical protein